MDRMSQRRKQLWNTPLPIRVSRAHLQTHRSVEVDRRKREQDHKEKSHYFPESAPSISNGSQTFPSRLPPSPMGAKRGASKLPPTRDFFPQGSKQNRSLATVHCEQFFPSWTARKIFPFRSAPSGENKIIALVPNKCKTEEPPNPRFIVFGVS